MIGEMIIWGFFAAFGSMGAYWVADKVKPNDDKRANTVAVERNAEKVQGEVQRSDKAECQGQKDPVQEVAR